MSETIVPLTIQPKRSYSQKRRLAARLRAKGKERDIARVVWHKDNAPTKGRKRG